MTISVRPLFEKGKTYELFVLFDSGFKNESRYLNVQDKKTGATFKVEIPVAPDASWGLFSTKTISFVCTEVTERGPEFALTEKYFPKPAKPKVGAKLCISESEKVEFKASLIYSPVSHQPDSDQPFEIAKQVAAMMNTDGGTLYLGVNDAGYVTGIENDYPMLGQAPILMNEKTDAEWTYHADLDSYQRKFRTAILLYLGVDAAGRLNDNIKVHVDEKSGLTYLVVTIPFGEDVTYLGRDESVVFRLGASVQFLKGRDRDQYVRTRFYGRGEKTAKDALELFQKENESLKAKLAKAETEISKSLKAGDVKTIDKAFEKVVSVYGKKAQYEPDAGFSLEQKVLDAFEHPSGILYKAGEIGQRMKPCIGQKSWSSAYEALLALFAELDPIKFEELPDNDEFCRPQKKGDVPYFVRKGNRVHLKNASAYLGPNGDVRADLRCGKSKASFLDEKSLVRRLMTHFGVDVKDIRIWNGK